MSYKTARRTKPVWYIVNAILALALFCCVVNEARATTSGREVMTNGAVVDWRVGEAVEGLRLGLSVPAFAKWSRDGFEEAISIAMHSDALAVIDAWELGIYRAGDTRFARPLRLFHGAARSLDTPLEWYGGVDNGPPLRPGETLLVRLSVRDVAGNVDHSTPQEILIARYAMRAERRNVKAVEAARARLLAEGERPAGAQAPFHGHALALTLDGWPDNEEPRASGGAFQKNGTTWTLRQGLPAGRHDIVIQSTRRIIGGTRAVPVGIITVDIPPSPPFQVAVKGTGKLVKTPATPGPATLRIIKAAGGIAPDWMVPGKRAISRTLTSRDAGEDRLALSLLSAALPVPMATDDRQRRVFLSAYDGITTSWPAGYDGTGRVVAEPSQRRMAVTYAVPDVPELFLPHTDVAPDSVRIRIDGDAEALVPFRDYFLNAGEGRILLGSAAFRRFSERPQTLLTARYTVPTFTPDIPVGPPLQDGGSLLNERWSVADPLPAAAPLEDGGGLLGKLLGWFRG